MRADEVLDVFQVVVFRVFVAGAGPQQALGFGPFRLQSRPARAGKNAFVQLIRLLGAGQGHFARHRLGQGGFLAVFGRDFFQHGVNQHVDTAEKEASHRVDARDGQARAGPVFEAVQVGFGHQLVALQAKNQGYVHVHALGDEAANGGQALQRGRHFNHHVGAVHGVPQGQAFGDGAFGVVHQRGRHFEAHVAVGAVVGAVVEGPEQVAGGLHVGYG